jgi:hypothetical protein
MFISVNRKTDRRLDEPCCGGERNASTEYTSLLFPASVHPILVRSMRLWARPLGKLKKGSWGVLRPREMGLLVDISQAHSEGQSPQGSETGRGLREL